MSKYKDMLIGLEDSGVEDVFVEYGGRDDYEIDDYDPTDDANLVALLSTTEEEYFSINTGEWEL